MHPLLAIALWCVAIWLLAGLRVYAERKLDDERVRSAADVERDDADDAQRVDGLRSVSERALSGQRASIVVIVERADHGEAGRRGLRSDDGVAKLNEAWRRAGDGGGNVGAAHLAVLYRRYAEDNGGCWRDEWVDVKGGE